MPVNELSAELICRELARLILNRLGVPEAVPTVEFALPFGAGMVYFAGVAPGGLTVQVRTNPCEYFASLGRKQAKVHQGGADSFLTLEAYSARFLEPAAAVLCNSITEDVPK